MTSEDLLFWLSWCVEEYAAEKRRTVADVSALFEKNGIYDYLQENAQILHTQGKDYILDCIEKAESRY